MRPERDAATRIEGTLARLLDYGTWSGVLLIVVGLVWPVFGLQFLPGQLSLVNLGVMVFIALPVLRVVVMFWHFMRSQESLFALLALLVLVIIALGLLAGSAEI